MKISLAVKALRELGPHKLGLFALYRLGLKTGYFRWRTGDGRLKTEATYHFSSFPLPLLKLPNSAAVLKIKPEGLSQLIAEADEIVDGHVRLFGGEPVPLNLTPPGKLSHWTEFVHHGDIKLIWEPARFGWAFSLGRAYHLTGDERYPEAFWRYFEIFQQANPVNLGPNWESAQEVALRIMAFTFAVQILVDSPHSTVHRQSTIFQAIASHSARIPPTLIYARAQNNNHLLSEAAGLITASLALPEHPQAQHWSKLGWKWFTRGLQTQITADGAYMQQSTNYHRLMLQLALWVCQVSSAKRQASGENVKREKWHLTLGNATHWLFSLCDFKSGRVPNLGPNDGAYILPLSVCPFADYRPVLQAASRTFLGENTFELGPWDEMSLWLQGPSYKLQDARRKAYPTPRTPHTLHAAQSWAYLRAAKFNDRPGHADQLHLDLWWRGLNVAQDAGTYLYNADPPWDNALTHTSVHSTVMVDSRQQMTPAGRFLFLDKAQAEILKHEKAEDGSWERMIASHDGYQRFGMVHVRSATVHKDDRWVIEDRIQPLTDDVQRTTHNVRLHWLLPDWEFEMQNTGCRIRIKSPHGWITLSISLPGSSVSPQLVRAGELVHGTGEISPTWGWISPTYGVKQPALSFSVTGVGVLPVTLISEWNFPEVKSSVRNQVIKQLADLICSLHCLHPVRVAIDGVDAAGKTTLADELAPLIEMLGRSLIRASVDSFHNPREVRYRRGANSPEGYYRDSFDYETLQRNLLLPLGPGGNRRYCRSVFNLREDAATQDAWFESPTNAILLFDGVFLLRPELIPHWDYTVFVDVDFDISVCRAVTRDAARSRGKLTLQTARAKYNQRYVPGQIIYLAETQPKEHANVIFQNNDLDNPQLFIK